MIDWFRRWSPLVAVADHCAVDDLWLRVDAAHGGFGAMILFVA